MKRNQNIQGFFETKKSKTTEDESQLENVNPVSPQQEPPAAVHMGMYVTF